MSRQVLQIKYHPAKKEITFTRVNSGKKTPITSSTRSVLTQYINEKGHFVLQDHGNQFFRDIVEAFDGEEKVSLEVTMTKGDFEDFKQMIDFFNETSDIKISASMLAELPDMNATYEAVKNHGLDSINVLTRHRDKFFEVPSDNENVKTCIHIFAKEINDAAKGISEKIETLEQNTVNICFSGPYSSGKSLLIDSLIGYEILPTDIRPETAAMFVISSPKPGEYVRVCFNILDSDESFSEVAWNERENCFSFVAGPSESSTRKKIQDVMNSCQSKRQHEQLHDILVTLNTNVDVDRVINVFFPISIDNDKVQFTIYDTPGTDSDISAHKNILIDALSEQTHSILVFVTYPNGLSGGGNRALLEYLSEIDQKKDKSTIDLGRSLFVINYADSLSDEDDFKKLREGKISNEKDAGRQNNDPSDKKKVITIKLIDKKVFFTAAKYAYPAVAALNGVASKKDIRLLNSGTGKDILDEVLGRYYQYDCCATSEYATKLLRDRSELAFKEAQKKSDLPMQMWIATGLFALTSEIHSYGEKYASAVKAFSIIDGVDKALARLNRNAESIERQNKADIKEVESEISSIKKTITDGIKKAKTGRELKKNDPIPPKVVQLLHLDADSISSFVQDPADEKVDDILLGFWQKIRKTVAATFNQGFDPKETRWDENKERDIENVVQEVLDDYENYFINQREKLLEKLRDDFISDVQKAIMESGEISDDAKKYIVEIDTPPVTPFNETGVFGKLYQQKRRTKNFLWMKKEYLDRESFMKAMNDQLLEDAGKLADSYKKNYKDSLNGLLQKVEGEFTLNMEKYSVSLRAKLEDKEAMENLRGKIIDAVKELHGCQDKLDAVIWEVKS